MSKLRRTLSKRIANPNDQESQFDLRRGPWTLEEDNLLIHYITCHGEGQWNSLAKHAGLKRTGKSCRLRWLNYLKPDIKRGNLTPQEQLLILELHSKWGNRWSKIAQHLPGRTDNEIKNYWRTRVQKQARQLNVDSNSGKFLEAIRCFWMPRLLEKMEQNSSVSSSSSSTSFPSHSTIDNQVSTVPSLPTNQASFQVLSPKATKLMEACNYRREKSSSMTNSNKGSTDSLRIMQIPAEIAENQTCTVQSYGDSAFGSSLEDDCYLVDTSYDVGGFNQPYMPAMESQDITLPECQVTEADWFNGVMSAGTLWNMDESWHFRKPEVGI